MINPIFRKAILFIFCASFSFSLIYDVSAQGTVVNAQASNSAPQVGSILIVTLKISNVQNLAGIDTTLQWNPSVLTLQNSVLNLGDSHSNGVLHGSKVTTDINTANSGDIYIIETKVSGSYELVAQAIGATNPGFTGSGTIAALTFNVIKEGSAQLSLLTDLADHPATGQTAQNINHQDQVDTVTAVASTSVSPTTSPTNSHTTAASISPTTPEYPIIPIIAVTIVVASAVILLSVKKSTKLTTHPKQAF
jgi:hypothetical protein